MLMKEYQYKVGILTEMSPAEAAERLKDMGKDGDLLGFNEGAGGRIVLKLSIMDDS